MISLLDDSTDDEMETKKQRTRSSPQKRGRYLNKGRQYNSRRSGGPDNDSNTTNNTQQRRRRSRRLQNKNGNHNDNETIQQPNPIQNPIIINGVDDDLPSNYNQEEVMEIHGSQSPAFMPSAHYNQQQSQNKYDHDHIDHIYSSTVHVLHCYNYK